MKKEETLFIASDHAGFQLKKQIISYLEKKDLFVKDLGPKDFNKSDDYPDYSFKVAQAVSKDNTSRGILICSTGIGMVISANKVKGIRAAVLYDAKTAKLSREHNNTNILALPAQSIPFNKIKQIIDIWISTPFSKESRHIRRLNKIKDYENKR